MYSEECISGSVKIKLILTLPTIILTADEIKILDDLTAPAMRYPKTFTNLHDQVLKDAKIF